MEILSRFQLKMSSVQLYSAKNSSNFVRYIEIMELKMKIYLIVIILLIFILGFVIGYNFESIKDIIHFNNGLQPLTSFLKIIISVFTIFITGMIGYFVGVAKTFREQKEKIYSETIQPILTRAYEPTKISDNEFNKSVAKLWLYSNKKVTKKLNKAISIMVDPRRGELTPALQETMSEMRKDIQLLFWQRLEPKDFGHIYMQLKIISKK